MLRSDSTGVWQINRAFCCAQHQLRTLNSLLLSAKHRNISLKPKSQMFGSSEDRARQLAGRKRKERIASLNSTSGQCCTNAVSQESQPGQQRSVSNSHHQPRHLITSNPSEQVEAAVIGPRTEHLLSIKDLSKTSTLSHTPRFPDFYHLLQENRQVLQAEHLSHVLYDRPSISAFQPSSSTCFGPFTRHAQCDDMETASSRPELMPNDSGPVDVLEQQSPEYQTHSCLLNDDTSFDARRPLTLTLRGGSGNDSPRNKRSANEPDRGPSKKGDEKAPTGNENIASNMSWNALWPNVTLMPLSMQYPWIRQVRNMPEWNIPISIGADFENFISFLSSEELRRFKSAFDTRILSAKPSRKIERRLFFQSLSPFQRQMYTKVITRRGEDLVHLQSDARYQPSYMRWTAHRVLDVSLDEFLDATETMDASEGFESDAHLHAHCLSLEMSRMYSASNIQTSTGGVPSWSSQRPQGIDSLVREDMWQVVGQGQKSPRSVTRRY